MGYSAQDVVVGFGFIETIVLGVALLMILLWLSEISKFTRESSEHLATLVKLAQKWDKRLEAERAEYEMFLKSGDSAKHE